MRAKSPELYDNRQSHPEELRLLNGAQTLCVRPGPGTEQGLRNRALLAVLLGSGLRISELLQLDRDQCPDKGFARGQVKGGQLRDFVPVQRDARSVLDDWLKQRGNAAGPLFPTRNGQRLSRREASGHQSDRYIWRYVKPNQQTLADAIDELE
jgi:site-specific recombinase XerC